MTSSVTIMLRRTGGTVHEKGIVGECHRACVSTVQERSVESILP